MSIYCLHCSSTIIHTKKFCNSSCAAKHNNLGRRRHGKPKNNCLICGEKTKSSRSKYCSFFCSGESRRKNLSRETILRQQRHYFMSYYTRKKSQTPPDADLVKIKEIYINCPEGHEVDHVIPLNKGGLHHQDNLQYLTISENRRKGDKLDWRSY